VSRVPNGEVLVRARGLTKRFEDFTAVDGIDFDLYRGEAFGFLGRMAPENHPPCG